MRMGRVSGTMIAGDIDARTAQAGDALVIYDSPTGVSANVYTAPTLPTGAGEMARSSGDAS